jgi:phage shock protein E
VRRLTSATSLVALATLVLSGCADDGDPGTGTPSAAAAPTDPAASDATVEVVDADRAVALLAERDDLTIIDVRTPEEHAAGHVAGTELFDIQAPDFADRIAALDPGAAYLVYCRSGNRSAVAVQAMAELGFVEVYDAGGFDDLAAAGAPTA